MGVLKRIIGFAALTLALYLGLFYVLSRFSIGEYPVIYALNNGLNLKGGNTYQKFLEFDRNHKYDAVVLGSSHAYRGYDPRLFRDAGYDVFNLGTSSQTPLNSYFLAKTYLTKENCGMLILDVFYVGLQMDGFESCADLIQNVNADEPALEMLAAMRDPRVLNMTALRFMTKSVKPYYMDTAYTTRGFSENKNRRSDNVIYPADGEFKPNERQLQYLERIIELCSERGIPLVLVDHPNPGINGISRRKQAHKEIQAITSRLKVVFIDRTSDPRLNPEEHYYDHTHLNNQGVSLFNELLIKDLESLGLRGAQ